MRRLLQLELWLYHFRLCDRVATRIMGINRRLWFCRGDIKKKEEMEAN